MRILVAIDGSDSADIGVQVVASASWPAGTAVRVVQVIDPATLMIGGPFGVYAAAEAPADVERITAENVERAAARLTAAGLAAEHAVLRGRPATEIVDAARELEADLVVLGSRGHGTIELMLLGSVSAEVVDHSPAPVLVARGDRIERIVLAWDGSDCAARAAAVLRWPTFAASTITVLGVAQPAIPWWAGLSGPEIPSTIPMYADAASASREEHERLARTMADELRAAGLAAEPALRSGDPAQEIIAVARARSTDLIVIGTHGRTGLSRLVLGSVARNVVQHAPCSVLVSR